MNFIDGRLENPQSVSIPTPQAKIVLPFRGEIDPQYVDTEITIGVRPQQIKVLRKKNEDATIPGSVKIIEFQGETTVLTIKLDDVTNTEVKAVAPSAERYDTNEKVWLHLRPDIIHLFDQETPILRREKE